MLAFLEKASFVNNQYSVGVAQGFHRIGSDFIAQRVGISAAAAEERLHPIGSLGTRLLGHQPAGFALDPGQQTIEESAAGLFQLAATDTNSG